MIETADFADSHGLYMDKNKLKRYAIRLLIVLAIIVGIKVALYVPIPNYLPIDDNWKLVEKHSGKWYFFYYEHVYCRFTISKPSREIKESMYDIISSLSEWQSTNELSSRDVKTKIDEEIAERYSDIKEDDPQYFKQFYASKIAQIVSPPFGEKFALSTEEPFVLLSCFGHKNEVTHWYINARIIDTGDNGCILELWDYDDFDH